MVALQQVLFITCLFYCLLTTQFWGGAAVPTCTDIAYNGNSYKFCSTTENKTTAQLLCGGFNMRLIVISSSADFQHWHDYLQTSVTPQEVWVGAAFSQTAQAYLWATGDAVPEAFFTNNPPNVTGVPDGMCVSFDSNQKLSPLDSSVARGFLCQETSHPPTTQAAQVSFVAISPECWCSCDPADIPKKEEEFDEYVDQKVAIIRKELLLDKETLTRTQRRLYSVGDNRISATSMGSIAVVTLAVLIIVVIWMDMKHISNVYYQMKGTFKPKVQ